MLHSMRLKQLHLKPIIFNQELKKDLMNFFIKIKLREMKKTKVNKQKLALMHSEKKYIIKLFQIFLLFKIF